MLKNEVKVFLKEEVIADALYTEKTYVQKEGCFMECSVWSSAAGYTVTIKRKITSSNRRNIYKTRDMFVQKVLAEKTKFKPRFLFDDSDGDLDALINDGFDYGAF